MKLTADLSSPALIHLKGALFAVVALAAAVLLLIEVPTLRTAALLALTMWASCRFYYYLFYVLERYLGREKRFAGVIDALGFLLSARSGKGR